MRSLKHAHFYFTVKPDNVQLLTNFTANKTCPGSFWNFTCLVGPAKPDIFSYQLLANDVVVDTDSSGMWVRLLSSSGVFTYKCLANNTVGTTISENEKNITVAGNYQCVSILQLMGPKYNGHFYLSEKSLNKPLGII